MISDKKITNPEYRKFLEEGIINIIPPEDLKRVLAGVKDKHIEEARSLIITLYLTGCRPIEALSIRAKDITAEKKYVLIKLPTMKRGVARTIYLERKNELAAELLIYANKVYPDAFIFFHFRSATRRPSVTARLKSGQLKTYNKVYADISNKLRYHFYKWFTVLFVKGIPPYVLRHNRFSQLAGAGATMEELRQIKGSKSFDSIMPYLHLSVEKAKKTAKKIR